MPKIVALLTAEGTACVETALYDDEDTPDMRAKVEAEVATYAPDHGNPIPGTWSDVSDNRFLQMSKPE